MLVATAMPRMNRHTAAAFSKNSSLEGRMSQDRKSQLQGGEQAPGQRSGDELCRAGVHCSRAIRAHVRRLLHQGSSCS